MSGVEELREVLRAEADALRVYVYRSNKETAAALDAAREALWMAAKEHAPALLERIAALEGERNKYLRWLREADEGTCACHGQRLSEYMEAPAAEVDAALDAARVGGA